MFWGLKKPIGNKKVHFIIIYNKNAGRQKHDVSSRIEEFFTSNHFSYEMIDPESFNWGGIEQRLHTFDEVRCIAAGGDGTLRAVFQKLWEHNLLTKCSVAFVPLGSANITALAFRLPFSLSRSLRRATHGKPKHIDLGLVNNKYIFFIMVSFGSVSRIVTDTKRHTKKRFGLAAYLLSLPALIAHSYDKEKFFLSSSTHEQKEMHSAVVCNHLSVAGVHPARGIAPDDTYLHCITLHNKTPWGFFRGLYDFYLTTQNSKVLQHTRIQHESFVFKDFKGVVHIDGDTYTDLGNVVEFQILPHAAKLVM